MRPYILKVPTATTDSIFLGDNAEFIHLDKSASASVTVKDIDGGQEFTLDAGDSVLFNEFKSLRVSHDGAGTETFTLWIGRDQNGANSSKVSGNIQPVGGSDNAATPPIVQSILDPLTPDELSASYFYAANGLTLRTILAPASNINGVKVTQAGAYVYTSNQSFLRIMAKSSAPASINDSAAFTLAMAGTGNSTHCFETKLNKPVLLPAGVGIYEWSTEPNYQKSFVNYEVL